MASDLFKRFKELSVIQKILSELERSLDIRDKVLAEFVLSLAKQSNTVMIFEDKLQQSGAEFSVELISNMYAIITKMLPECFERKFTRTNTELENDPILSAEMQTNTQLFKDKQPDATNQQKKHLASQFPSLAQKNDRNKEEIDLFGDDDLGLSKM